MSVGRQAVRAGRAIRATLRFRKKHANFPIDELAWPVLGLSSRLRSRKDVRMRFRQNKLAAAIVAAAFTGGCKEPPPAAPPPPPEVYVLPVVQKDVPVYLELVAQAEGFQDID